MLYALGNPFSSSSFLTPSLSHLQSPPTSLAPHHPNNKSDVIFNLSDFSKLPIIPNSHLKVTAKGVWHFELYNNNVKALIPNIMFVAWAKNISHDVEQISSPIHFFYLMLLQTYFLWLLWTPHNLNKAKVKFKGGF